MIEIGIELVTSHSYGRLFAEGFASHAARFGNWRLRPISAENLTPQVLAKLDGAVARILNDATERIIQRVGIPFVDIYCAHTIPGLAQVTTDNDRIGRLAAEFFLSKGFENYGWYGLKDVIFSDERRQAFTAFLRQHGKTPSAYTCSPGSAKGISSDSPSHVPNARQLGQWLKKLPKPIAIFCCNDLLAYHLAQVATGIGLNIPKDISILGSDNDTLLCSFAPIAISSVNVEASRVGHAAATILHAILNNPPQDRPHKPFLVQPRGIVERESTSFSPIGPPWFSDLLNKIETGIAEGISTADAVAFSGFSSTHVERLFYAKLGKSVQSYITDLRMRKATALLQTSDLSVKEIAFACGYRSSQYFCRAFKAYYGKSPKSSVSPQ